MIFLTEFSSDANLKWPMIVACLNFSGVYAMLSIGLLGFIV